jgi:hypothetical protein
MSLSLQHHYIAHEHLYVSRRKEYLEKLQIVLRDNDPIEWERLQDEYADVCEGTAFLELLKERCGYAPVSLPAIKSKGDGKK